MDFRTGWVDNLFAAFETDDVAVIIVYRDEFHIHGANFITISVDPIELSNFEITLVRRAFDQFHIVVSSGFARVDEAHVGVLLLAVYRDPSSEGAVDGLVELRADRFEFFVA